MTSAFELDQRLSADTFLVAQRQSLRLLLMNDARYPWFILVPAVVGVEELYQLSTEAAVELGLDSLALSRAMARAFQPHKLNVASLGNVVRQLHVHHVARRVADPAWPGPVWGHSARVPYDDAARRSIITRLLEGEEMARRGFLEPPMTEPGVSPQ